MDQYNREWIISTSVSIVDDYEYGDLTIRALHYKLVGCGMPNTMAHYKRVVKAMEVARWSGDVAFEQFSDLDRAVVGETKADPVELEEKVEEAKGQIRAWMNGYSRNRWEWQKNYVEVWIEKKTLQNVFAPVCERNGVALAPCKGYPSLTFINEAAERFDRHPDKPGIILYFGDYDPSGEDIPRSVQENINRLVKYRPVYVYRCALSLEQVQQWDLPHAPTKETDSRTAKWDGIGQVELDAVDVKALRELAQAAIDKCFDTDVYQELLATEEIERQEYIEQLRTYVRTL